MKKAISLLLVLSMLMAGTTNLIAVASADATAEIWVDPTNGSDTNTGSQVSPVQTITKAKTMAAALSASSDVTVWLCGGTYSINETITFSAADAAQNGNSIVFKAVSGETPAVSGGTEITGWMLHDAENNIYKASVTNQQAESRQFYVDGVHQTRAKTETSATDWELFGSHGYVSPAVTSQNTNEYLILDLGETKMVSSLILYPNDTLDQNGKAAGFPSDFTIETSTDGTTFTVRRTETAYPTPSCNQKVELTFSPVSARYVKLNVTKLGTADRLNIGKYMLSLSEVKVGTASVAIGDSDIDLTVAQHIATSSNYLTGAMITNGQVTWGYEQGGQWTDNVFDWTPLSRLIDGDLTVGYVSTQTGFQRSWISDGAICPQVRVMFNQTASISAVSLTVRAVDGTIVNAPQSFDIQVLVNNTWTTVKSVANYAWDANNPTAVFAFDPVTVTGVRIAVRALTEGESGNDPYFQLMEMAIYKPADIAAGCVVTAPNSWEYESMSKDNLTQGYISYMYTSNSSTDPYGVDAPVTVDLGSIQSVGGVRLYPRKLNGVSTNYPSGLRIAVSTDGVTFDTVLDLQDIVAPTADSQLFVFPAAENARYIKVVPTSIQNGEEYDGSTAYRFQLMALEVAPASTQGTATVVPNDLETQVGAKLAATEYAVNGISVLHDNTDTQKKAIRAIDGYIYEKKDNLGFLVPDTYQLEDISNIEDVELHLIHYWCHSIIKVEQVSSDGTELYFDQSVRLPWYGLDNDRPTWVENAYNFIDEVGEWYIDKATNTIYYKSAGTMSDKTAVLPVVEQLLVFDECDNITFDGVRFEYTTWTEPNSVALDDAQSGTYYVVGEIQKEHPAGIETVDSNNIQILNCEIRNLGAGGIRINNGSEGVIVKGNAIHDISSGGIFVGSINGHGEICTEGDVKDALIQNNYITRVGIDYFDSSAITAVYTNHAVIDHNEIENCPYTGISLGWGWDFATAACAKDNVVSNNYIHNVGITQHDGGPIYTLGDQPGTKIFGNYVHTYNTGEYDKDAGLYTDEGTSGIELYSNVVGDGVYWWQKIWTTSITNNHWHDNYYTVDRAWNNGTDNIIEGNTYVANGDFSSYPTAQSIINNAGLTDTTMKSGIALGCARVHDISLELYTDSPAYYISQDPGLLTFTIPNQVGTTQYNKLAHIATILMPTGTDVTNLSGQFTMQTGFSCDKYSGSYQNFSNPVSYTFADGESTVTWTVRVICMVSTSGDPTGTEITLDSFIASTGLWSVAPSTTTASGALFSATNGFSGYIGSRIDNDEILKFDMQSELYADQEDWTGFALRSQDPYTSLGTMYHVVIKNDSIELQKWVNGSRTMLFGTISGFTPVFGNLDNDYYTSNTRHSIKTGAIDVEAGVRLFLYIDGHKIFDIIDTDNPITDHGFFVMYPMTHDMTLLPFTDIDTNS